MELGHWGLALALCSGCGSSHVSGQGVTTMTTMTNQILEDLPAHHDAIVLIEVGTENWMMGRIALAIQGSGDVRVTQVRSGVTRTWDATFDALRIGDIGRQFASDDFTRLQSSGGARQPGDVPVILRITQGEVRHDATLWHGDRFTSPALDRLLTRYDTLVREVSNGLLPYGPL